MDYSFIIWIAVIGAFFAFLWHKGYLMALSRFVGETREELRKCSWPSKEELKGSTVVVLVATVVVGLFTVGVDVVVMTILDWLL